MSLPAYVINLDRDEARLSHVLGEAARHGLAPERIRAVEGLDVPAHLRGFFLDRRGAPLSGLLPGEVGCYASHLLAAEQIVEAGHHAALVVEDDVGFAVGFCDSLDAALAALPSRWDILRLSSATRRAVLSQARLPGGRHLVRYSKLPKSSGAYVLSRSGAQKLLSRVARVRPIDADLRYGWLLGLDTYGIYPQPVFQPEAFPSRIRPAFRTRTEARGRRWPRPGAADRIRGGVAMLSALGLSGWLACSARNMRLVLAEHVALPSPPPSEHRIVAATS
jgi:glycosyl transferase, family 25